jgi:hypothetical protein
MATSVPKSYQATVKHPAPPPKQGQASPVTPTFPHTFTDQLFQVPEGKTWQVLKMLLRHPAPMDTIEFFRLDKASSGGAEQMVLHNTVSPGANEEGYDLTLFRDLVLEDQETIRQLLRVSGPQIKFTAHYEISVLEFTP